MKQEKVTPVKKKQKEAEPAEGSAAEELAEDEDIETGLGSETESLTFCKKRGPDNSGVVYVAAGLWRREIRDLKNSEENVRKAVAVQNP